MDKNAIRKYAVWARNELIERVSQKADQYEISADANPHADSAHGVLLTPVEKKQRASLVSRVRDKGMNQIIAEVAYTWFNRFAALRFMEVNNYLPSRVRVFTNPAGEFKPEILSEAIHLDLDGLDMEKVYALKETNNDGALFKYLIITQCNALSSVLPGMFQKIEDYTELLFPDNLLRKGSVVEQMVTIIPENDWKDQVQIIGWLYQYYNTELKDQVFANLKKKKKITKDKIPAATQLFTPDWIVHYMVENSLGRLWLEGHPDNKNQFIPSKEELDAYIQTHENNGKWYYYLEGTQQEPEVQKQLEEIHKISSALKPEDILCVDPCMGSGHILCYLFDLLMQIYVAYGYTSRDAASNIIKNNLYGLDLDERAAQLAYFSVMMKACQYDKRLLARGVQPHVYAIVESNDIDPHCIEYFANGNQKLKATISTLVSELHDAKEYGSILGVTRVDFQALYKRFDEIADTSVPSVYTYQTQNELLPLVKVAEVMAEKYHIVVTNPPYMTSSNMNGKLADYVKKNYADAKADLFACFMERCHDFTRKNGYQAMITQHAWMFLSSFEKMRTRLLTKDSIINMAHLGARAFEEIGGEVVQTTAFVLRPGVLKNYKGIYARLVEPTSQQGKEGMFLKNENRYSIKQVKFKKIPGSPVAYWFKNFSIFDYPRLGSVIDARIGMISGNNQRFMRYWYEIGFHNIEFGATSSYDPQICKWYPLQKGGDFRLWYGNLSYVINWWHDGFELKYDNFIGNRIRAHNFNGTQQFKEGITWNSIASGRFSCRYTLPGFTFDAAGPLCEVIDPKKIFSILAFLSSKVTSYLFSLINPTMNFPPGYLECLPLILPQNIEEIDLLVEENISISKDDWDAFETSWDFQMHPIVQNCHGMSDETGQDQDYIEDAFNEWKYDCDERFQKLKKNEEELNRIFIHIYGLEEELTPEEEDQYVTVRKADLKRDIKSFISYAVGCMFGRYSLDADGLVYAGGEWDESKYKTFIPDKDAIIPITDDEYFTDDIVGRFVKFVKVVYGADTLEENLKFIADALGGKGLPREVIRKYFLKDFFKDHCKVYKKRPIYWLFDSGKNDGFKCLIYMHRYQSDTLARIRTDYVHEQQARYRTAIDGMERQINRASTSERVHLNKQLSKLKNQAEEIRIYEEKIHHLADQMIQINLDDGVKHNYAIFQDVLAKIK